MVDGQCYLCTDYHNQYGLTRIGCRNRLAPFGEDEKIQSFLDPEGEIQPSSEERL